RAHGEPVGDPADVAFEVTEEVTSIADIALDDDKRQLSVEDLETGIRRSQLAFADLLERGRLPEVLLDWRVPKTAVKIELYPDVRSIRDMLEHASGSSGFFPRNVGTDWIPPAVQSPADVPVLREAVFARIRSLTEAERSAVFTRTVRGGESQW